MVGTDRFVAATTPLFFCGVRGSQAHAFFWGNALFFVFIYVYYVVLRI